MLRAGQIAMSVRTKTGALILPPRHNTPATSIAKAAKVSPGRIIKNVGRSGGFDATLALWASFMPVIHQAFPREGTMIDAVILLLRREKTAACSVTTAKVSTGTATKNVWICGGQNASVAGSVVRAAFRAFNVLGRTDFYIRLASERPLWINSTASLSDRRDCVHVGRRGSEVQWCPLIENALFGRGWSR